MRRQLHPDASHVADTLIARGHHGVIVNQERPTRTAAAAAAVLAVEIGAIIRSLVFLLDDDPVLLLISGAHEAHLDRTGNRLGGTLTYASTSMAEQVTGQSIAGTAPLGHPTNLPTYLDNALSRYPELWAAGGYPDTVFRTTFRELVRITAGLAIDVD
ncbi:YbaK/EbsC family protein [Skermania piniformis]|uniref:YbaK/EbsC family protein n=1 Tax=Skermania pinensis TaxID=39122 RepID=A0ABX8S8M9_9ACTN|nr:YbaK/EbsC family protein [Skermania piniformis]QXQ14229.1 YbaK/EbsC family protein [Skermania piniformis]